MHRVAAPPDETTKFSAFVWEWNAKQRILTQHGGVRIVVTNAGFFDGEAAL